MKLYKMSTIVKKTSRIGGVIVSGGNRRTRRKPPTCEPYEGHRRIPTLPQICSTNGDIL